MFPFYIYVFQNTITDKTSFVTEITNFTKSTLVCSISHANIYPNLMSDTALKLECLRKKYPKGPEALKGVSLEIKRGEFFGLLGPNGSGKTTMINIISGPTRKTSGKVHVFGVDQDEHEQTVKKMLGVVPQELVFDSFFTVEETLKLTAGYYGADYDQAWAEEILTELDLIDKRNTGTRKLSGGMKRRLLIAKALIHKPDILFLDEPTAGVDVELRRSLWKFITKLNKSGLTILLTTHYLEEAEQLCDKLAIINKGQLVTVDKTENILEEHKEKGSLEEIFIQLTYGND